MYLIITFISNDCKADNGETFQFSYSDGSYGFTAEGEFHPFSSGGTDTSDATAYAKNIEAGYTAYCRGEKITGTARVSHGVDRNVLTPLSNVTANLAATTVGDYALFGGGYSWHDSKYYFYDAVDSYDNSLVKSSQSPLSRGRQYLSATNVGDYALFGGGMYSHNVSSSVDIVDTYDIYLTKSVATSLSSVKSRLAAGSNSDYALFACGYDSANITISVDAYNTSLTRSSPRITNAYRENAKAATAGEYIIIGGGTWNLQAADVYSSTLTYSSVNFGYYVSYYGASTSFRNYAMFSSGEDSSGNIYPYMCEYNDSLTSSYQYLGDYRSRLAASSIENYALFAGGWDKSNRILSTVVDKFDSSFTRSSATASSVARKNLVATSVGDYAIFAGGENSNTTPNEKDTVEAYYEY